jgi:transposase-like protein
MLSEHRDIAAAKRFFIRAIERHGAPERITLDGYPATHTAVAELKRDGGLRLEPKVWTSKYLNNIIEQDHRLRKTGIDSPLRMRGNL